MSEEMAKHYKSQFITLNKNLNQSFLLNKSMEEEDLPKKSHHPNAPMTMDEIIKDYKYAFIYVLDFLTFHERIQFTGIHRGFKIERAYLFNMKKDEAICCLELKDREKLDDRIFEFKLKNSKNDITAPFIEFEASKNAIKTVQLLDQELFSKLFKIQILDDYLEDIYIIYRLLFVLLGENEIADIMDDRTFWVKCTEYLVTKSNGKIGSFISGKIKNFNFSHRNIYLMNRLLFSIKQKIIPPTFSKISTTTGLLFFLIKDSLEYCGVLPNDKHHQVGFMII